MDIQQQQQNPKAVQQVQSNSANEQELHKVQDADLHNSLMVFKKLFPTEYNKYFINSGCRNDGRALSQFRPIAIAKSIINASDGSALCKIGLTNVICGIRYFIDTPKALTPKQGRVDINVNVSATLSSDTYGTSASSTNVNNFFSLNHILAEFCKNAIESGDVVDLEKLSIQEGKSAWVLQADILVLNNDGNIFDACLLSLVAALQDVKLPNQIVVVEHDGSVKQIGDKVSHPQGLIKGSIVSMTFAVFGDSLLVADPTFEEEKGIFSTSTGDLTTAFLSHESEFSSVSTGGSGGYLTVLCDEKGNISFYKPGIASMSLTLVNQDVVKDHFKNVSTQLIKP